MTVESDYIRGGQLVREARGHIGYFFVELAGAALALWLVWEHIIVDVRDRGLDWTVAHKPFWLWALWLFLAYWGFRWLGWAGRNLSGAVYKYPLGRRLKGSTLGGAVVAGIVVAAVMVIPNSSMSTFMSHHPGEVNDAYHAVRCSVISC